MRRRGLATELARPGEVCHTLLNSLLYVSVVSYQEPRSATKVAKDPHKPAARTERHSSPSPVPGLQCVLVPVPEADPLVDDLRRSGDWSRRAGIPAHITIAGPWPSLPVLPVRELEAVARESLRTPFSLDRVDTLGDAICLLPGDQGPLQRWRRAIFEVLGQEDSDDRPWHCHLTIRRGFSGEQLEDLRERISPSLPLECEIQEVRVLRFLDTDRLSMSVLAGG
jgi:hypothetical protein